MWHHKFTEVPLAHLRVQLLKTAVCKNPDISEMSASWIDTVLCSQLDLCSLNYVTMLISIIFHTCCRIWIHFVRVKVLHTYTLPNCTSSQCLAHTAHSISFMSPELMHRPSGYLAHCASGKLERVSSSFSKRQRKMLLIAEQRRPFSAHSSRLSMSIRGDECQHISKHAHFLYSVHMRADGAPNAGLQNLPANPPPLAQSAHLNHLTQWQQGAPQGQISQRHGKCVFEHIVETRTARASQGCRESSRVTLYWIIWINNREGCRGSRFHWRGRGLEKTLPVVDYYESIKHPQQAETETGRSFLQAPHLHQ